MHGFRECRSEPHPVYMLEPVQFQNIDLFIPSEHSAVPFSVTVSISPAVYKFTHNGPLAHATEQLLPAQQPPAPCRLVKPCPGWAAKCSDLDHFRLLQPGRIRPWFG